MGEVLKIFVYFERETERENAHMSGGGAKREGEKDSQGGSMLSVQSSMVENLEIMT